MIPHDYVADVRAYRAVLALMLAARHLGWPRADLLRCADWAADALARYPDPDTQPAVAPLEVK